MTINTHNRAESELAVVGDEMAVQAQLLLNAYEFNREEPHAAMVLRREILAWHGLRGGGFHIRGWDEVRRDAYEAGKRDALLDAARAEGPVQGRPRRGEIRIIAGKRSRFIEADDRGDVWEILDDATPPADEVGRAVELLGSFANEAVAVPEGYAARVRAAARLILSHVSRLEGELSEAHASAEAAQTGWDEADKQNKRAMALEGDLKLAVEALERVTDRFKLAVAGKPVRDMAETLAEVSEVLRSIKGGGDGFESVSQSASPPLHQDTLPDALSAAIAHLHRIAHFRPLALGWPEGAGAAIAAQTMEDIALEGLRAAGCTDDDLDRLDTNPRHHIAATLVWRTGEARSELKDLPSRQSGGEG